MADLPNNVIEFKRKEEDPLKYVWQCGHCEGLQFYLLSTDNVECTSCGQLDEHIFTVKRF